MEEDKPMKSRPSMDDDGPWDQGKLSHTFELIFDQVKLCTESAAGGRCRGMFAEGECWLRGSRELQQTLLCSENQKLEFIGEAEARVYWRTNFLEGSFRRRGNPPCGWFRQGRVHTASCAAFLPKATSIHT